MSFDPALFVQSTVEGVMSTQYVPIPEGEYTGLIKEVKGRMAKESAILDVIWVIDDPNVRELTGMEEPQVRQSLFLDVSDSGMLDMGTGKNVQLGRLRAALGQNDGRPWSPVNMEGKVAKILVTQRKVTEDKEGRALPESEHKVFNDVKGVMPL